jgi:hypothetical protein
MNAEVLFVGADGSVSEWHLGGRLIGALNIATSMSPKLSALRADASDDGPAGGWAQVELQAAFHQMTNAGVSAARRDLGLRNDSFSASMGVAEPLDLTSITNEVLTQPLPELTGLSLFASDPTLCKPGAAFYRQRRRFLTGAAAIHGAGSNVPLASVGRTLSGPRPTRYIVSGAKISLFDKLGDNFQGLDSWRDSLDAGNRALNEYHDRLTWLGDSTYDIWGILNFPYCDVLISSTAISASSTTAQIVAAISQAAHRSLVASKGVFAPNAVVMSLSIWTYLTRTFWDTSNATNANLLTILKEACPHITKWSASWRLDDAGPSSADGLFFYRDDKQGPVVVTPIETTMLPVQTMGFDDMAYMFKQIGGVWEREPAAQLICWFTT